MDIIIKISNDPTLGFVRKLEVCDFQWSLQAKELKLFTRIRFYENDEITEISNGRIQPYSVTLLGDNSTNVGTEDNYLGEYDYFISTYFGNNVNLVQVITGIVLVRDSQQRFDI